MIDIIAYLLPMSGEILISDCFDRSDVRLKRAVIPENFEQDCEGLMNTLEQRDIPYTVPTDMNDDGFRDWVERDSYHVGVSVGYDKKIPGWLVDNPEHGTMNIHPSLLPRYRGANPYFWVIRHREPQTGVTLHFMDEEFDTGPLINQQTVDLEPDETMGSLFFLLNRLGVNMAMDAIDVIRETGEPPNSTPQEQGDYPDAPEVTERHLRIDWEENIAEIDALVRAGNPFFGAFTTFRGATVRIYELEETSGPDAESEQPGEIVTTDHGPKIRCGDGWVLLTVVQMEQLYKSSGREFQRREKKALEVLDRMI